MDYRDLIETGFRQRQLANPRYSLRQFARDLGLNPMHLYNILKKKRGLSKKNALQVAGALGIKGIGAQKFKFIVSLQSGRSVRERNLAKQALTRAHFRQV